MAVRLPGRGPGGRETRVRKFGAFYGVLREMAGWLASQGVTHVAMEATGVIRGRQRASATAGDGPGLPVSPSAADGLSGEPPPRGQPTTELIPLRPLVDAAFALPVADASVRARPAATPSLIFVTPDYVCLHDAGVSRAAGTRQLRAGAGLQRRARQERARPQDRPAVGASWLAELLECGLLRGSFIPPADIKAVRDVVRYRRKIALTQLHYALSPVSCVSPPGGVSGSPADGQRGMNHQADRSSRSLHTPAITRPRPLRSHRLPYRVRNRQATGRRRPSSGTPRVRTRNSHADTYSKEVLAPMDAWEQQSELSGPAPRGGRVHADPG